jgi:hypothetical protein
VFSRAFWFFEVWERIPELATHGWRLEADGIYATATVCVRAAGEDAARARAAAMLDEVLAIPEVSRRRPALAGRLRQACR